MALKFEPRVRETSSTTLTSDFVLSGAMWGSMAFGDVMAAGDTCYYVASYANTFEEALGTMAADGKLTRPATTLRSLHADGTINTGRVSFAPGIKTIIMTFPATLAALLPSLITGALRFDVAQSLSAGQKTQVQANFGFFPSGTKRLCPQASAPTGWTVDNTHHDKVIRLISSALATPGAAGGVTDFTTIFSRTAVDTQTLTAEQMPAHPHSGSGTTGSGGVDHDHSIPHVPLIYDRADPGAGGTVARGDTSATTGGASAYTHAHSFAFDTSSAGGGGPHLHGLDLRVQYLNTIIATKD